MVRNKIEDRLRTAKCVLSAHHLARGMGISPEEMRKHLRDMDNVKQDRIGQGWYLRRDNTPGEKIPSEVME